MEEKKYRIRKLAVRDGSILLAGGLYAVFVRLTGLAVPCVFRKLTGWLCPGCGITRACLSLMRGDIKASFSYNPFLYIAGPCIIYLIVKEDMNYIKNNTFQLNRQDTVLTYILIAAALVFGVARNL